MNGICIKTDSRHLTKGKIYAIYDYTECTCEIIDDNNKRQWESKDKFIFSTTENIKEILLLLIKISKELETNVLEDDLKNDLDYIIMANCHMLSSLECLELMKCE